LNGLLLLLLLLLPVLAALLAWRVQLLRLLLLVRLFVNLEGTPKANHQGPSRAAAAAAETPLGW
jgi:hypothetical protein